MAVWVFCVNCSSRASNGDFNDGTFWWNATTAQQFPLDNGNGPRYVPSLTPGDNVYWAVQVDGGQNNGVASDLRAAVGRKRGKATIGSPFRNGSLTLQNAGGAPQPLSVTGTNPSGSWAGVGPFTVVQDPGMPNQTSKYDFVLTATLSGGAQFGEDPEMDVNNGM